MKKTTKKTLSIVLTSSLLLAGCGGEFAYKRGASARDLEQAKQQCQHTSSETALGQCMEQNGWIYHNPQEALDDEDPVIQASFQHDYRSAGKAVSEDTPAPASSVKNSSNSSTVSVTETGNIGTGNTGPDSAAQARKPGENTAKNKAEKKVTDPMDIFLVSSWWKIGKGADGLKTDMDQCVAKLGPAHAPDMTGKTAKATRGLLLCMRDLGWKALQARE